MPSPAHHAQIYTVAFAGFSEFERTAMASFFRLTVARAPAYEQLHSPSLSDFLVADADQASALQAVQYDRRLRDTVFIGAHAPPGAVAWLPRPIDPMQIVRELDSLVELRTATPESDFDVPSVPGDERSGLSLQLPEVDTTFYATEAAPLSPPEFHPHAAAVRAPTPAAEAPPTPPQPGVAPRSRNAARDVLVVEDSAIARKFLARRLQLLGYRVQLASSGEEALSLLAQHAYAIVFLDIVLGPQGSVDGLQVCHTLRKKAGHQIGPRSAVVMVTGLSGPTDRVRGTLAGCDAYLTKPLHEAEFMATLRRVDPGFEWHRGSPAPA